MDINDRDKNTLIKNTNWDKVSNDSLSEHFIGMFFDNLDLVKVTHNSKLSETFLCEHADKMFQTPDKVKNELILINIATHQKVSEYFVEKYMAEYKFLWSYLCTFQRFSEDFLELHKEDLDWRAVSINQHLSEEFMLKYKTKLYWRGISINQGPFSDTFLEKVKDYIDLEAVYPN
jgi:hypothetical protein